VRRARKILLVHIGGLGDTIHQLPALHAIHRANPAAELHVLAGGGALALFKLFPWIARAWSGPQRLNPGAWPQLLQLRRELRATGFDLALTFWPRDTLAPLLWLSGAPWRMARAPQPDKPAPLVRLLCNQFLEEPWFERPWCEENCRALARAGLAEAAAPLQFGAAIAPDLIVQLGLSERLGRYLHVSPFSTADRRDPPLADLARLLNGVHAASRRPVVISTTGDERQLSRLRELRALLDFEPWRVFAGALKLDEFAAVIAGSALHLGPDSGGIHVAAMVQRPVLAWFRNGTPREQRSLRHFKPPQGEVFCSADSSEDALRGLSLEAMIAAAARMLETSA
jgi:ADP-heptose:LPS heptosyltransferase